jgi:hypothetical protein
MDKGGRVMDDYGRPKGSDTPINRKLQFWLDMNKYKDVRLLEDLAPFSLPPFDEIYIDNISDSAEDVKHFLYHSIGQLRKLGLNCEGDLSDGSEWVEAIVKALPSVKKEVSLYNFSFLKEQVETIVDNSLHLEKLLMGYCKLRKCFFICLSANLLRIDLADIVLRLECCFAIRTKLLKFRIKFICL